MNDKCISEFNSLLRGEISAVETYDKALEKVEDHPQKVVVEKIRADHMSMIPELQSHIRTLGGEPDTSSGAWGTFANAVTSAATLFGEKTALKALKEGEEHGLKEYESSLELDTLKPECISLLEKGKKMQERHLSSINSVMESL